MSDRLDGDLDKSNADASWTSHRVEPIASSSVRDVSAACAVPGASLVASRILLADDLDLNRKLIADMLTIEGHSVTCAPDGAAAVRAASEGGFDLILMDMIMPVMDGMAATLAIRALPAPICDVPIVALTANSFPEQLEDCLSAGMNATLTKPMSMDALIKTVEAWTRRRPKAA